MKKIIALMLVAVLVLGNFAFMAGNKQSSPFYSKRAIPLQEVEENKEEIAAEISEISENVQEQLAEKRREVLYAPVELGEKGLRVFQEVQKAGLNYAYTLLKEKVANGIPLNNYEQRLYSNMLKGKLILTDGEAKRRWEAREDDTDQSDKDEPVFIPDDEEEEISSGRDNEISEEVKENIANTEEHDENLKKFISAQYNDQLSEGNSYADYVIIDALYPEYNLSPIIENYRDNTSSDTNILNKEQLDIFIKQSDAFYPLEEEAIQNGNYEIIEDSGGKYVDVYGLLIEPTETKYFIPKNYKETLKSGIKILSGSHYSPIVLPVTEPNFNALNTQGGLGIAVTKPIQEKVLSSDVEFQMADLEDVNNTLPEALKIDDSSASANFTSSRHPLFKAEFHESRYKGVTHRIDSNNKAHYIPMKNSSLTSLDDLETKPFEEINLIPRFWTGKSSLWKKFLGYSNPMEPKYEKEEKDFLERAAIISFIRNGGPVVRGMVEEMVNSNETDFLYKDYSHEEVLKLNELGIFTDEISMDIIKPYTTYIDYERSRAVLTAYGEYLRTGSGDFSDKFAEDKLPLFNEVINSDGLSKLDKPNSTIRVEDLPIDHLQYLMLTIKKSQAFENEFYKFIKRSTFSPDSRIYREFKSSGQQNNFDYTIVPATGQGGYMVEGTDKAPSFLDYAYIEQMPSDALSGSFALAKNYNGGRYSSHFISPYKSIIDLPDFAVEEILFFKSTDIEGELEAIDGVVATVGDDNYIGPNVTFTLPENIAKSTLRSFRDLLKDQGVDLVVVAQTDEGKGGIPLTHHLEPNSAFIQQALFLLEDEINDNYIEDRTISQRIFIPINTDVIDETWMEETDFLGEKPHGDVKYMNMGVIVNSDAMEEGLMLQDKKEDIYIPDSNVSKYISEFNFLNNYNLVSLPVAPGVPDLSVDEVMGMDFKDSTLPPSPTSDLSTYQGIANAQIKEDTVPGLEILIKSERPFDTTLPINLDYGNISKPMTYGTYTFTQAEKDILSVNGELRLSLPIGGNLSYSDPAHWVGNTSEVQVRVNIDQLDGVGENAGFVNERAGTKTYPEAYDNNVNSVIFNKFIGTPGVNFVDYNELVGSLDQYVLNLESGNYTDSEALKNSEYSVEDDYYWDFKIESIDPSRPDNEPRIQRIDGYLSGSQDKLDDLMDELSGTVPSSKDWSGNEIDYDFQSSRVTYTEDDYFKNERALPSGYMSDFVTDGTTNKDELERAVYSDDYSNAGLLVLDNKDEDYQKIDQIGDRLMNTSWEGQLFGIRGFIGDNPKLGYNNSYKSQSKAPTSNAYSKPPELKEIDKHTAILEVRVTYDDWSYYKPPATLANPDPKWRKDRIENSGTKTFEYLIKDFEMRPESVLGGFDETSPILVKSYNSDISKALGIYPKVNDSPTVEVSNEKKTIMSWFDQPQRIEVNRKMYDYTLSGDKYAPEERLLPIVTSDSKRPMKDFSRIRYDFEEGDWVEDPADDGSGTMGALNFNFSKTPFIPRNIASAATYWYNKAKHNPNEYAAFSSGYGFKLGTNGPKKIGELTYMTTRSENGSSEIPAFIQEWLKEMNRRDVAVKTNMNDSDNMIHALGGDFPFIPDRFEDNTTPEPIVDKIGENEYSIDIGRFTYTARLKDSNETALDFNVDKLGNYTYPNAASIVNQMELVYNQDELPLYHHNLDIQLDLDGDNAVSQGAADYLEQPIEKIVVEEDTYEIFIAVPSDITHYSHRRMPDYAEVYFQLFLDRLPTGAGGAGNDLVMRSKPSWLIILGEISDALN